MHILVVLPTYNEAQDPSEEVLRRVRAAVPKAEVLVVDDASPDGTADVAVATGEDVGRVHVLRRDRRIGFGDSYRSGFVWGIDRGASVFAQMDSDLSMTPVPFRSSLPPSVITIA